MKKNNWLIDFSSNVYSQRGEDGILEKIFEVIGDGNKWCVEFGAWDGKHLSNTHNLVKNKGWFGVFIESEKTRFKDLLDTYKNNNKITCVNELVQFEGAFTLDNILKKTIIPKEFDVLSIDIDGNDYHIWDSLKEYFPRVVVIEFNATIPTDILFVQPKDMKINQGSSLLAMVKLGNEKGYELISCTNLNAIFIKKEYYKLFDISNNSPESIFLDKSRLTRLFQLYDGTVMIDGFDVLGWHGIRLKQNNFQPLPFFFRVYPGNMGVIRMFLFKIWRKIYNILFV